MDKIKSKPFCEELFRNKKLNENNIIKSGFRKKGNVYKKEYKILDNTFILRLEIEPPNIVKTVLKEIETNEIYTLYLTDAEGTFVGKIRKELENILREISENCFEWNVFKSKYTYKIIEYVREKYGDEVEYLWEKFPDNAVARRKDNSKWYLAILTVKKDRLGLKGNGTIEVIDLRAAKEDVPELLKQEGFYPAYHMNKKSWITIILDGYIETEKIYELIDKSYTLAKS